VAWAGRRFMPLTVGSSQGGAAKLLSSFCGPNCAGQEMGIKKMATPKLKKDKIIRRHFEYVCCLVFRFLINVYEIFGTYNFNYLFDL